MGSKIIKIKGVNHDDENFDFGVGRERIHLSNGQDTKLDALYRKDTGSCLSIVSPNYKITTHKDANEFVTNLLQSQNIDFEIGHTAVANGGNRFFREIRFPSLSFIPGDGSVNSTALDGGAKDEYCPTIIMRNSYDKSSALNFLYGGFRFVCSNGLITGDLVSNISIRHIEQPDFEVLGPQVIDNIEATVEGFKRVYTNLNSEPADAYLKVLFMEVLSQKMMETAVGLSSGLLVPEYEDKKLIDIRANPNLSAYALYNLATNVATHSVRKYHRSIAIQKKIATTFAV